MSGGNGTPLKNEIEEFQVYGLISQYKAVVGILFEMTWSGGMLIVSGDKAIKLAELLPRGDWIPGEAIDKTYSGDLGKKLWKDIENFIKDRANEDDTP